MHTTRTKMLFRFGLALLAALLLTLCLGAAAWADDNPGQAPLYTVTLPAATDEGAVTADRTEAAEGETVTLTVSPGTGYALDDLSCSYPDGTGGTRYFYPKGERNAFPFTMPAGEVTVTARFGQPAISLSDGGSPYVYTSRRAKNAFDDIPDGAAGWTLTLLKDVSGNNIEVAQNKTATLDLNGHILRAIITVSGDLTLTDSAPSAAHEPALTYTDPITGEAIAVTGGTVSGNTASMNGGGVSVTGGTFTMNGGSITGNNYGGGVSVGSDGTFTMNGGSIAGSCASYGGVSVFAGTFTMNGGSITGNSATYSGGGVYVSYNGTFTMNGGSITGNSADDGGGVYANGTFTMSGTAAISGNTAKFNGGGVYVEEDGSFEMSGGTISGNGGGEDVEEDGSLTMSGGGVYVRGGTFTMSGTAAISGNTAKLNGGGVYVKEDGSFEMSGTAAISGNTAKLNGGGVYVEEDGSFEMSGGTIDGNMAVVNGGGVAVGAVMTDASGMVTVSGGSFTMSGGTISGNTAYSGSVYIIDGTFTMTGGTICDNEIEHAGGGVCVQGMYTDENSDDKEITAVFTMSGGTIEDNTVSYCGGGVYIGEGAAAFTMSGEAAIKNNTVDNDADGHGGGVCSYGTFDMNGGTISDNTAYAAGGVYNGSNAKRMKMSGGTVSGNTASMNGGGVVVEGCAFDMSGGTISGNTANMNGGGVYFGGGTGGVFTMSGTAAISGNTAQCGGGVCDLGDVFTMSGEASITGNRAIGSGENPGAGGGVYADGTFTMADGSITGNSADEGGGVSVNNNGTFRLQGAPGISGNTGGQVLLGYDANTETDARITVAGVLTNTTPIGVTMENPGVFTAGWADAMGSADPAAYFASETANYGVRAAEGELTLTPVYTVTLPAATARGAVTADRTEAAEGETVTLTVSPGTGYALDALSCSYPNGTGGTRYFYPKGEKNAFPFTMPAGDVTVTASFDKAELSLTDGGSTYVYTSRRAKNAFGDIPDGAAGWTLTLLKDVSGNNIEVAQNKTATLDLNGHILRARITVSGDLTLTDSAPSAAHEPALTYTDPITGEAIAVTGGAIIGGSNGSGVNVNNGGTFTMAGGSITGSSSPAGGVYVGSDGTFTMNGGSIAGNSATTSGGGVYVGSDGTFTMNGGSITGNSATTSGGVYVGSDGTFTMNGGSITGNSAAYYGGGVHADGTFTMAGGSITGNRAALGGGVYANGTFTMAGGSITGNSADEGGVYVNYNGTFRLQGAPGISGNTGGQVRLRYDPNSERGSHITVTGVLTYTTPIGVSMNNPGVFTEGWTGAMGSADPAAYFASETENYGVRAAEGELTLTPGCHITLPAATDGGAVTADRTEAAEGETVTLTVTPAASYVLPLNGLTVSCTDSSAQQTVKLTRGTGENANKWTFTMPGYDVTVSAAFAPVFGTPDFTLPAALTEIDANAFEGAAMTVVFVPDSCTSVGAEAFKDCAKLTQIRLPKDCAIASDAFSGCTSLIAVYAPAGGTTESRCRQVGFLFVGE